ncbi:MAG TPA: peptidoglycan-binding domain-containing protein [Acetobacteraceae bacterium]|nr:peptidoglycan-binding domain-containing protein [Acetobacteraceae bacterium]
MVRDMKRLLLCSSVWLLASAAAFGQTTPPPLTFVQPVPPVGVQAVQDHLRAAGAYGGAVDGEWGPDSEAALQRFQASRQLQATGQLNQATAVALGLDTSALLGVQLVSTPPQPMPNTLRSSSVRAIQARLHDLGFYSGSIDGIWGQSTQVAIQQFQQNRGLQPNGDLNQETLAAMGLRSDELAYR